MTIEIMKKVFTWSLLTLIYLLVLGQGCSALKDQPKSISFKIPAIRTQLKTPLVKVKKTPAPIKEVVVEMEEMIKGGNVLNHDQKSRQEKSFQIILECDKLNHRQYQFYRNANARIGTGFLETYWSQLCQ